jgi:hypothetical protein
VKKWGGAPLLWAVAAYLLAAVLTTHPLWLHLDDAVPSDIGDPLLNTWIMAWSTYAFLEDPLHLFDANLFFPLPNTLAYSEHLASTSMLSVPIQLITGEPVVAYDLSLLISFPLAGLGMYLLVRRWTGSDGAAFLSGLAFALAPYRLASISHLQLLTVQWLPFSLLALDLLLCPSVDQRPAAAPSPLGRRWKTHVGLLIVFTLLQVLASWYLAVFTLLVLSLYALLWLIAHSVSGGIRRPELARLATAGVAMLVVVALALPFALPYVGVLSHLREARPVAWALSLAARPSDYAAAAAFLRVSGPLTEALAERPGFTEENTLYVGIVTPLLALAGLIAGRPRWRIVALASVVVSAVLLTFAGPYGALSSLLPILAVVRVPPRWIIPATFGLAVLAGFGSLLPHRPRIRRALIITCGLLLVVESFAAPLPLASVGSVIDLPPVYSALASDPQAHRLAVVELPMYVAPEPEYPETPRLYASTQGWWGLVNGYSGFTPARQRVLADELAGFPDPRSLEALRALGQAGVTHLVVHPDEAPLDRYRWDQEDRWEAARATTLVPLGRFGADELYLIDSQADRLLTQSGESARVPRAQDLVLERVRFVPLSGDAELWLLGYRQPAGLEVSLGDNAPPAGASTTHEPRLTLYWLTSSALDADYTIFVHSLGPEGTLLGQADGPPVGGHYPTSVWLPGEVVQDSRLVLPGSVYLVGLYDPLSGQRLPAFAGDGSRLPDDALRITVEPP